MAKQQKETPEMETKEENIPTVEPKLVVSNKESMSYDIFIQNALYSHAHGMLDYKIAFLKSIDLVRAMVKEEK